MLCSIYFGRTEMQQFTLIFFLILYLNSLDGQWKKKCWSAIIFGFYLLFLFISLYALCDLLPASFALQHSSFQVIFFFPPNICDVNIPKWIIFFGNGIRKTAWLSFFFLRLTNNRQTSFTEQHSIHRQPAHNNCHFPLLCKILSVLNKNVDLHFFLLNGHKGRDVPLRVRGWWHSCSDIKAALYDNNVK